MNIYYFLDGICSSFIFFYYTMHRYSRELIINQIEQIYILPFLERFIFYYLLEMLLPINLGFVFVIPIIQNGIFKNWYNVYYEHKWRCIKFILSKRILWALQKIHSVKNYYVFEIYNTINYNLFCEFLNNISIIFIAHTFKTSPNTYFYYTILKYHSFFSNAYSFTISNYDEAITLIHTIVKEHAWSRLKDIDTLHAIFIIMKSKVRILSDDAIVIRITFAYFEFFTFYYLLLALRLLPLYIELIIFCFLHFKNYYVEHLIVSSFIENDVIALLIIYLYGGLKVILTDTIFYFREKKQIDKMIKIQKRKYITNK